MKPTATLIAAVLLAQAVLFSQTESAAVCSRMLRGSGAQATEAPKIEVDAQAAASTSQEDEEMHKMHKIFIKKIAVPVPVPVEVPQYIAIPIPVAQPASAVVSSSSNTVVSNTAAVAPGAVPGAPGFPGVTPAQTRPGELPQATPAASIPRQPTPAPTMFATNGGAAGDGGSIAQPVDIGGSAANGALGTPGAMNGASSNFMNTPQNRF